MSIRWTRCTRLHRIALSYVVTLAIFVQRVPMQMIFYCSIAKYVCMCVLIISGLAWELLKWLASMDTRFKTNDFVVGMKIYTFFIHPNLDFSELFIFLHSLSLYWEEKSLVIMAKSVNSMVRSSSTDYFLITLACRSNINRFVVLSLSRAQTISIQYTLLTNQ